MEKESLKISKNTQKFIDDVSRYSDSKYEKVMNFLEALENQQGAEAQLENKRGWRYMWQRTPKPYLLMMAYFVFLAPVGSTAYFSYQYLPEALEWFVPWYFVILGLILFVPLIIVGYLSYHYVKNPRLQEEDIKESSD